MLTPNYDVAFTYPKELGRQLLDRFGNYTFDIEELAHDKAALIDSVHTYTSQQREVALFLLQEQPWDFFAMVFTGPDRLQHFLWNDMDTQHPLRDPETSRLFGQALLEHYRVLDGAIARILDRLPADTLVLLISDHGFNGCARRFYVNRWLSNQGLLTLNEPGKNYQSGLMLLLSRLGSVSWLRHLKRVIFPTRLSSVDLRSRIFAQTIDWPHTQAYFGLDGGLRINLRGREPKGTVPPGEYDAFRQKLRQELLMVVDPETKHSPISQVLFREELYQGPFSDRAPDMILEPQRDNPDYSGNFILDGSLEDRVNIFGSSAPYSGNHALDGIFVAYGAGVASGQQIQNATIVDIAPTVMALLDVPIPKYMDGRVLSEVFSLEDAPAPRYITDIEPGVPDKSEKTFSPEEEAVIENRLKDLGYLS